MRVIHKSSRDEPPHIWFVFEVMNYFKVFSWQGRSRRESLFSCTRRIASSRGRASKSQPRYMLSFHHYQTNLRSPHLSTHTRLVRRSKIHHFTRPNDVVSGPPLY